MKIVLSDRKERGRAGEREKERYKEREREREREKETEERENPLRVMRRATFLHGQRNEEGETGEDGSSPIA